MDVPELSSLESDDALLRDNLPLVRNIALSIKRRLPPQVDLDDLMQAGAMGLLDAVKKFDSSKSVPFACYAKFRIRGAILDSLRNVDELGRADRKKQKQANEENTGVDFQVAAPTLSRVRVAAFSTRDADETGDRTVDPKADPDDRPDWCYQRTAARKMLTETIGTLTPRYRQLIALYYDGGMTMREIGVTLGINESRVSQMHRTALNKMALVLNDRGIDSSRNLIPA